ncbi:ea4a37c6-b890-4da2-9405-0e85aafaed95 [Thermothielavioides terrestris]|nr:ea4a37c6-b890-4da2-9405-0e85aafaed95 [Thermothielavioides terrestris]
MSDNHRPPLEPGTFRAADGTIRRFRFSISRPTPTSNDRPTETTSERLYTVIQQFHHDLDRLSRHFFVSTTGIDPGTGSMASGSDRGWRRLLTDPDAPNLDDRTLPDGSAILSNPPSLPPLRSLGSRARPPIPPAEPPSFRSSRYRPANRRPFVDGSVINSTLDELNRNIDDTNSQLRALLDFTNYSGIMPRQPPSVSPPLLHDAAEESRRVKRRKLDSDRLGPSFRGFHYGRYGQIEPGQLTMEIVSCDGGLYSDEHSYAPENILKSDASVYCTKGNRCNIVLKHQGGTVFTLEELIIKAPAGSRFSCPVREGMVFVAMESDELLTRTAQYQIQYLPVRGQRRGPVIFRHDEDGGGLSRLQSRPLRAYSYGADDDDEDDDDDDEDCRTAQIPPEFAISSASFNATTELSDDESDEDNPSRSRAPPRQTPNRIGQLAFESDTSDEGIAIYRQLPAREELRRRHRVASSSSASRARRAAGVMTLEEAQEASQIATQEAVRAVGGELMAPLAHFFIEKDKNKCTIRFDPPVSARFLLLKMWSPRHDPHDVPKNIDIQGVVAKGFAGPRYSPAIDLA